MGSPDSYPGNMGVWRSHFSFSNRFLRAVMVFVCVCVIRPDESRHGSPEVSDGGFRRLGYGPLQRQPCGIHDASRFGVQQQQSHDVRSHGGPLQQRTRYQFHTLCVCVCFMCVLTPPVCCRLCVK